MVVTYMLEDNEIYNSILEEFQLSGSILEEMKKEVEAFAKSRMNICKLLKIPKVSAETLDANEKEFIKNININKSKIKGYQKKQIELKNKIKVSKQEIKVIKLHINKLESKLIQEQIQSKKNNEALRIFIRREKFKFIKKIIFSSYRKVFLQYSNESYIKTKIMEGNKRKEEIRKEKQNINNSIDKYNRKIIVDKIALAKTRKSIITMQKRIDLFLFKIQRLVEYKEIEKIFRLEFQHRR